MHASVPLFVRVKENLFVTNRFRFTLQAAILGAVIFAGIHSSVAQDSGFNLDLHANSHATAKDIGLPLYPGASPWKDNDKDSSAANLGFGLNSFHFGLLVAEFSTSDSSARVLDFYRKPLSHYGEVLECDKGKPVGALTVTKSGLTCSGSKNGGVTINGNGDSSNDHELRAGTPLRYRVVGISETKDGRTKFGLVYLELPKDSDSKN
jgi:hypothetical protein